MTTETDQPDGTQPIDLAPLADAALPPGAPGAWIAEAIDQMRDPATGQVDPGAVLHAAADPTHPLHQVEEAYRGDHPEVRLDFDLQKAPAHVVLLPQLFAEPAEATPGQTLIVLDSRGSIDGVFDCVRPNEWESR